jgi:hypothetical protein
MRKSCSQAEPSRECSPLPTIVFPSGPIVRV